MEGEKEGKWVESVLCCAQSLSHVWLSATLWTIARQGPLPMEFSRQEYCSGFPCPPPGESSDPRIEPMSPLSPALQADSLPLSHLGSPKCLILSPYFYKQKFRFLIPLLIKSLTDKRKKKLCGTCRKNNSIIGNLKKYIYIVQKKQQLCCHLQCDMPDATAYRVQVTKWQRGQFLIFSILLRHILYVLFINYGLLPAVLCLVFFPFVVTDF